MKNAICKSRFGFKVDLKMKISAFLLVVSLFQLQANTSYSQKKISMKLSNVTIESVFKEIEENTEFNILYKNSSQISPAFRQGKTIDTRRLIEGHNSLPKISS